MAQTRPERRGFGADAPRRCTLTRGRNSSAFWASCLRVWIGKSGSRGSGGREGGVDQIRIRSGFTTKESGRVPPPAAAAPNAERGRTERKFSCSLPTSRRTNPTQPTVQIHSKCTSSGIRDTISRCPPSYLHPALPPFFSIKGSPSEGGEVGPGRAVIKC